MLRHWCLAVLAIVSLRLSWHGLPLERDTATYAVAAHELLQGKLLYSQIWDHKPPGIHLIYALAELLFGYGQLSITILGILSGLLAAWAISFLVAKATERKFALPTFIISGLLFCDPFLEATQVNTENFIVTGLALALVPVFSQNFQKEKVTLLHLFSLLFVTYLKPQALLPVFVGIVACFLACPASRKVMFAYFLQSISVVFLGIASLTLWTVIFNTADDSWQILVEYNSFYAGSTIQNFLAFLDLKKIIPRATYILLPLLFSFFLTAFYLPLARFLPLALTLLASFFSIAMTGKFYNHYYLILLPVYLLSFAIALNSSKFKFSQIAGYLYCLLVLFYQLQFLRFTNYEFSTKRHGPIYHAAQKLGESLNGKSFYNLGSETSLYFYSKESPLVTAFYALPMLAGPEADRLMRKTITELKQQQPEFIIVSPDYQHLIKQNQELEHLIQLNYRRKEDLDKFFLVFEKI